MKNLNRRKRLSLLAATSLLFVGLAATFAASTDSTSTGELELNTEDDINLGIDIRIAGPVAFGTDCQAVPDGDFEQTDTTESYLSTAPLSPGQHETANYCLRNFGSTSAARILSTTIANATDGDAGCTGSEADSDPDGALCSPNGEISPADDALTDTYLNASNGAECDDDLVAGDTHPLLSAGEGPGDGDIANGTSSDVSALNMLIAQAGEPTDTVCVFTRVFYDSDNSLTLAERESRQSDSLAWEQVFEFDAV